MSNRTFADRELVLDSVGDDFERFVFEALSASFAQGGMVRRLGRGRDGAIDIVAESDGKTTIIECKHVGDCKYKTARERWKGVQRNLSRYLPKLAANPKRSPNSPYRFWLDPSRPVRHYLFCVSAILTNNEARALAREIQEFFNALASKPGLDVLDALGSCPDSIEVKSWDNFEEELNARPALAYRWFGGLPNGARLLNTNISSANTFHGFLFSSKLPFFSRSQFMDDVGITGLVAEDLLVKNLEHGNSTNGLVITGPGGVGKTRLSLEIGKRLQKKGWLAISLNRQADGESVSGVLRQYRSTAKVVFTLDYAEAASALDMIAEAVRQGGEDGGGHEVRLVVTCRASAFHTVQDTLADFYPDNVKLGSGNSTETAYLTWVVSKILNHGDISDAAKIERICGNTPALAAFALFLFSNHRDRFEEQFAGLHRMIDFQSWARRRIDAITGSGPDATRNLKDLADLSLSFPLPLEQRNRIVDGGGRLALLLDKLEVDRWVEPSDDHLIASHDVLTDSIAARWLIETPGAATTRVTDALRRAASAFRFETAVRVIDRLAAHPSFATMDGAEVIRRLASTVPQAVVENSYLLMVGRMLSEDEKIQLLHDLKFLRDAVTDDRLLDGPVSGVAEYASTLSLSHPVRHLASVLQPILDRAVEHPHRSNIVLRRAYTLFPDRYRPNMLAKIDAEVTASDTHFLIARMLRSGESPQAVLEQTMKWLEIRGRSDSKAVFVYKAWLDAGGSADDIRAKLFAWIHLWRHDERAVYLSKTVSEFNDLPDDVLIDLAVWSEYFSENEDAIYRISRVSRYLPSKEISDAAIAAIRRSGVIVLLALRRRGVSDDPNLHRAIGSLLTSFAKQRNEPAWGVLVSYLLSGFVADGQVFCRGSVLWASPYLLHAIASALRAGMLHMNKNSEALAAFADWLRESSESPEHRGTAIGFLRFLQHEFPSELWDAKKNCFSD